MMRIALICPSNMLYMPYVKNYEHILVEQNIDYDIINWDRFQMEEIKENTYRDKKKGHQRNFLDYLKYKKFLMNRLNSSHYDKIIVFGIQLSYFLKKIIKSKYKEKCIIDIRDHNKILNFFNLGELIECSASTILSSPGYKEWLPKSNKYVINHNTQVTSINELKDINIFNKDKVYIANIGAIRDLKVNKDFINNIKDNEKFELKFHGESDENNKLKLYINSNHINNVLITGRYKKEDEEGFYNQSDLINVLRYRDGINNKTSLPNRLYNAVLHGKPLLTYEGTALAKEIRKYNLGLILSSMNNLESEMIKYLNEFDYEVYKKGRISFLYSVTKDNKNFYLKVKEFLFKE
ncbi:hypothetical protein DCE79_04820 [Lysinibacillus sp. 2017]|uniref:hypothetical protein n=1 Tax=unclassified Lysinibacillus TaxID=2636778 RepID=UPI000D528DBB|nr:MULTISPECIES: hypothetical protein [unclassified Lysinibacillus]AWE06759.1 hypothetical protein DCE79_04820 [Lysinibacillus sp. 2017]TGN37309.1 hypothetical protein E4L99_02175 [Lysinibacillus sp. S2017]